MEQEECKKILEDCYRQREVRWQDLTVQQRFAVCAKQQFDAENGDVTIYVASSNPYIEERIQETVPFSLQAITFNNDICLVLVPEFTGSGGKMIEDDLNSIRCAMMPVILPTFQTYIKFDT